jgi:hypothetical protein
MNSDGQLVREVSIRWLGAVTESKPRELQPRQFVPYCPNEVLAFVAGRPEPSQRTVFEDGVEQHHALDHPSLRRPLPKAAIGFVNRRPEWLVVKVEHAPPMELARRDRCGQATVDKVPDEVRGLLAVDDAGELAVLAFEEDTRVEEDLQKEPCLAVREAERGDGLVSIGVRLFNRPALRRTR